MGYHGKTCVVVLPQKVFQGDVKILGCSAVVPIVGPSITKARQGGIGFFYQITLAFFFGSSSPSKLVVLSHFFKNMKL